MRSVRGLIGVIVCSLIVSSSMTWAEMQIEKDISHEIDKAVQQVNENSQLPSEEKNSVLNQLGHAKSLITDAETQSSLVASYEAAAKSAASTVSQLKERTRLLIQKTDGEQNHYPNGDISSENSTIEQLANELIVLTSEQNSLLAEAAGLQNKQTTLNSRSTAIAGLLVETRETLSKLKNTLVGNKTLKETPAELAINLEQQANRFKLQQSLTNFERELATISARQTLVAAQLGLVHAQITQGEKNIAFIQQYLAENRRTQAEHAVKSSEEALSSVQTQLGLSAIAQENLLLAKTLKDLILGDSSLSDKMATLRSRELGLQQAKETVDLVLTTGRVTDELGELLRQLRAGLPQLPALQQRKEYLKKESVQQQLNLILWQNRLRDFNNLGNITGAAHSLLKQQTPDGYPITENALNTAVKLTETRITLLSQLIDNANIQRDRYIEEELAINKVMAETTDLASLLDRRLIWLPSSSRLVSQVWKNLAASVTWLIYPSSWRQTAKDLWRGATISPFITIASLMLPFLILIISPGIRRSLKDLFIRVGNVEQDTYWITPLALLESIVLALPLPLFVGTISWLISAGSEPESFSSALAAALAAVSSISLVLLFFRSMCQKNGIFVGHFGWSDIAREKLRAILFWFVCLQTTAAFLFALAMASGIIELRYGLAMFAFIAASIGIVAFNYHFFKPKGGIGSTIIENRPVTSITFFVFPVVVATPLLIGLLPLFGFFDTAVELQFKVFQSGIALIFSAVFYGILIRFFLVAYGRFLLRQLAARREEAAQLSNADADAKASGDAVPTENDAELPDLDKVKIQARSILTNITALIVFTSLWFIWKPLLPALGIINDIVLWQRIRIVDGVGVTAAVTLSNIIFSIIFTVGGFIAARNIRGILEVGVFERFNLDAGARYATITILGYLLVGLGIITGLGQLGIDWSKLQWIIAALGVGLGFGLQEIVANFISGLIILFERPIRIGDIVTIGTLSGTVSNIKIRATTVTDFDNREVLLPNKSIITQNVTNWTLNNAVTRIVLTVGVAYGTDINNARQLLMKAIESNPDALSEPPPTVFFMRHGDSALEFELRIFVAAPAKRLPVTHDINTKINEILKENDIEIPFPQRDLNIRGENVIGETLKGNFSLRSEKPKSTSPAVDSDDL
jgi:potassium efflux system protein